MNSLERKEHKKRCLTRSATLVPEILRDHQDVIAEIAYALDIQCQHKLATGRDDLFGSVTELRREFDGFWPQRFSSLENAEKEDDILKATVFDGLLSELHHRGDLVLVGDRQRARSRAFEVVHYLRRLKQRTHSRERLGLAPELVDMIKVEVQKRERPIRSVSIDELMDDLEEKLTDTVDFEQVEDYLSVPSGVSFEYEVLPFAIDSFRTFLINTFSENGAFPVFQQESFYKLLKDAFQDSSKTGRVIAAGTGFGKTEAFLLPLMFYAVCIWFIREKRKSLGQKVTLGFSGLLLYPRVDLCNNQAERLLKYLANLNEVLESEWNGDESTPLKIAIAHSRMNQVRIQCPLCVRELDENNKHELDRAYIVADAEEGSYRNEVSGFKCQRSEGHSKVADLLIPQIKKNSGQADFGITTVDTLHRRLMDDHGQQRLFKKSLQPPRFVVVDEMHIYEGQAGSHVSHILRRCRQRIRKMTNDSWNPVFVGASATAGSPTELAFRMFGAPNTDDTLITPSDDGKKAQGLEYYFFLQASGNRFLETENEDDESQEDQPRQFVSEAATMIQAAMCLSHTIKRPSGVSEQKRRTLGFIDSIDVATRLARDLDNAEWQRISQGSTNPLPLYALRFPVGVPNATELFDSQIRSAVPELGPRNEDSQFQLPILGCKRSSDGNCVQPPHPFLERCERYEQGECWHAMARDNNEGLLPLEIQVHKSGSRKWGNPDRGLEAEDRDNWRLLVSTSALEVGFDHPELIATWQYHAPPSIASFVQRKGRGGRGITDFPITMVVLGKSFGDVFRFQDHLKLVVVSDEDIASVLDESNPSIREQHLFSALLDFCAGSSEFKGAYNIKNIKQIADACDSRQCKKWLGECFDMKIGEIEAFAEKLKNSVLEIWDRTLKFDSLESSLRPKSDIKPVDLFSYTRDQLTQEITKLKDPRNEGQNPTTLLWMKTAHKAVAEATETKFRVSKIVDFCRFLPQQFVRDDIYVPSTTIPVPIGRFVNVVDAEDRHLGVEASEFGLKCFLPGGFKIRYNNRLWMAPWDSVPNKPRDPESSRIWVGTQRSIVTSNKHSLEEALSNSTLDSSQRLEVNALLGNDCIVGEVDTLCVENLGKPTAKRFSMELSTLRIVRKRPEDADSADYQLLARDPHVTSKFIYIPESNEVKSNVSLGKKLPSMSESKIRFYDRFKLTLCFYANLVNCYPTDGDSQTIVLRFWDESESKPIAPSIKMRTQAMEFRFNEIADFEVNQNAKQRVFWSRLDELLFEKMVIETGFLRSVYLVPSVTEALQLVEPSTPFCDAFSKAQIADGLQQTSVTDHISQEILLWCISHIDNLTKLIEESRVWCESVGIQRTSIDSLGAALTRVAAKTINVSPTMFRRKTFFSDDGPRVILFDDVEGGSGNTRRLRDVWQGKSDLEEDVLQQVNCPASEVDSVVFAAFDSGLSPEALTQIALTGNLPEPWISGKREHSVTRAKLRLQKMAQDSNIAAFNSVVRQHWCALGDELGRSPTWLRLFRRVLNSPSLDIRAENLKQNFLDKELGSPNELKARVQEMMPLCESACPECLMGEMFAEREFIDREVLASFLSSGSDA